MSNELVLIILLCVGSVLPLVIRVVHLTCERERLKTEVRRLTNDADAERRGHWGTRCEVSNLEDKLARIRAITGDEDEESEDDDETKED